MSNPTFLQCMEGQGIYIYIIIYVYYIYINIPCIFPISPQHSHLRGWLQGGHIAHVAP